MAKRSPNRSLLSWTRVRPVTRRRLLIASSGAMLVAACGTTDAPDAAESRPTPAASDAAQRAVSDCVTVAHDAGESKVCGQPESVAVLSVYMLDLLLSLGVQPAAFAEVGVAQVGSTNLGAPVKQVKYLGERVTSDPVFLGDRAEPSIETLLRVQTDLILGELGIHQEIYDELSQVAPTVLVSGADRDEWQRALPAVALALGDPDAAGRAIEAHRQRITAARAELAPTVAGRSVLLLSSSGIGEPFGVFTPERWAGGLMEDIGITLVVPQSNGSQHDRVSLEFLPQIQADEIIVAASGRNTPESAEKEWNDSPVLRLMPATRDGRVHFVDYQLWSRIRGPIAAELVIEEVRRLLRA
ncbi:MAG: ABC transporter substrate-binding protein [Dehalococcoidia bacterium]